MDIELIKYLIPVVVSGVALILQLYIASKVSPLDKRLSILNEIVTTLKEDNGKQWEEITRMRSDLDYIRGQHYANHDT